MEKSDKNKKELSNKEDLRHVELPHNVSKLIKPKDQLIYVIIRSCMDGKTYEAYPSLDYIRKKTNLSINSIRKSIKTLELEDYFKIKKKGRRNIYLLNKLKKFEPFSYGFIDKQDINSGEKAILVAIQEFMIKDVEGVGKISFTNKEMANRINTSESNLSKVFDSLENKGYLKIVHTEGKDFIELGGCNRTTKVFNLNKLEQAIIWKLQEHETKINKNIEDIDIMKKQLKELNDKLIKSEEKIEDQNALIRYLMNERKRNNYKL